MYLLSTRTVSTKKYEILIDQLLLGKGICRMICIGLIISRIIYPVVFHVEVKYLIVEHAVVVFLIILAG